MPVISREPIRGYLAVEETTIHQGLLQEMETDIGPSHS